MSESEFSEPVIRDRRRIDPQTGKLRTPADPAEGAVHDGGAPAGADAEAPDDTGSDDAGTGDVPTGDTGDDGQDAAAAAKAEAADLFDQLQRAKADLYNLDQRYSTFVRRSRSEVDAAQGQGVVAVAEALIPVLDDIAAAREHGELTGPFGSVADKLEATLAGRFELERFGAVGEVFDPAEHEALMHQHSEDATENTITTVLQSGYRVGDKVIRPARVAVTGPQ